MDVKMRKFRESSIHQQRVNFSFIQGKQNFFGHPSTHIQEKVNNINIVLLPMQKYSDIPFKR